MKKITHLEIKNYRQFEKISLDFNDSKGIFLFIGDGGLGKTNIINAISWCLYGDEPLKDDDETKRKRLLNEHISLDKDRKHEKIEVSIDIEIDGEKIKFKRWKVETDDGGLDQEHFDVYIEKGGDKERVDNPNYYVNNFLPQKIRNFFMFSGENIKNTFSKDYAGKLKDGVWQISYVDIVNKSIYHLNQLLSEERKRIGKEMPELDSLTDRINRLEEEIVRSKDRKSEITRGLEARKAKLTLLEVEQKKIEKYKDQVREKQEITDAISREMEHLDNYKDEKNELISKNAPFIFLYKELGIFSNEISKLIDKGMLPPKIASDLIDNILQSKNGTCICGDRIDDKKKKYLEQIKIQSEKAEEKSFLTELRWSFGAVDRELSGIYEKLKKLKSDISNTESNLEKLRKKEKDISMTLSKTGDKVGTLEDTINKYQEEIEKTKEEMWNIDRDVSNNEAQVILDKKDLEKYTKDKEKLKSTRERIDFLEKSVGILENICDQTVDQVRRAVSGVTKKYFKELFWKEDFVDIIFNEDYTVEAIKDIKGNIISKPIIDLSNGEKTALGFATMKALADLSGFKDMPVFIDGPLSPFGQYTKDKFIARLPEFMPDKQVFIFSLDDPLMIDFGKNKIKKDNFYKLTRGSKAEPTKVGHYE